MKKNLWVISLDNDSFLNITVRWCSNWSVYIITLQRKDDIINLILGS